MSSFSDSKFRIIITISTLLTCAPLLYYSYTEPKRRSIIAQRKKNLKKSELARRNLKGKEREGEIKSEGITSVDEEGLKERYASLVVGGRFTNPFTEWRESIGGFEWAFWKLVLSPLAGKFWWDGGISQFSEEEISKLLPVESPRLDLFDSTEREDKMLVMWIGQSTTLVRIDGISILTDPVFSNKTIDTWLAPPRLRRTPCDLEDLPAVDIVLVSHSHPDHISPLVVSEMSNSVLWIVPLGLAGFFTGLGVDRDRIIELDWWQSFEYKSLTITGTPTMHWTARSPFDVNSSLWCSFAVQGNRKSFFHAGDSGYCDVFKAIGNVYGPFDLALLPIGAYAPRWHLRPVHCNPEDAAQIHLDLKAKKSIPVHWGTWTLSDERFDEPPKLLEKARLKFGIEQEAFDCVPVGRVMEL